MRRNPVWIFINIMVAALFLTAIQKTLAQTPQLDSLKKVLARAKHDTTRCNVLNQMVELEWDDKIWPVYNNQLLEIAERNAIPTSPFFRFFKRNQAGALNNIGFFYQEKGDSRKALEYYSQSLAIQQNIKDENGLATSLNNMAFIYQKQGEIEKAMDYYLRALKLEDKNHNQAGTARALNNLGVLYDVLKDTAKAVEYYKQSLKIRREINDLSGISTCLNNIGSIYKAEGKTGEALACLEEGLQICENINDATGTVFFLTNIGLIYFDNGKNALAVSYYKRSLKIASENDDKEGIMYSLNYIANALLKSGQIRDAENYAKKGLAAARELGFPEAIRVAASTLKTIYLQQKKPQFALEMFEMETQMRDSIFNDQTKKSSIKKQLQYEYEKKAAADSVRNGKAQKVKDARLKAQTAQISQQRTQRNMLLGGFFLLLLALGVVINRFRLTRKQKIIIEHQKLTVDHAFEKLAEKNKEVLDSIHYAKRIQTALVTSEKYIDKTLMRLKSM